MLNEVDTIVFDKTGTLTQTRPQVGRIYTCPGYTKQDVLTYAAAAEHRQTHPIAKAIQNEAKAQHLRLPAIESGDYQIGYGLTVTVNNRVVRVGSYRFLEQEQLPIPPTIQDIQDQCNGRGNPLVLVSIDHQVAGALELHPTIRPEAHAVIQELRRRHIQSIYMISGDHMAPTRHLADTLGIDHYVAEVLPEDKAGLIQQLQQDGKSVCYVGDWINDAIALQQAHVSISLKGAATVATDTAQVILMDESLSQLCHLFDLAQDYRDNMRTSFLLVLLPHLLGGTGALFWHFGLLHSIILSQIGTAMGLGNSIWPLRQRQQAQSVSCEPKGQTHDAPHISDGSAC